jgi:hypothetical protein
MGAGSFETVRDRGPGPSAGERARHAEGGAVEEVGVESRRARGSLAEEGLRDTDGLVLCVGHDRGDMGPEEGARPPLALGHFVEGLAQALTVEVDVRDPAREALGAREDGWGLFGEGRARAAGDRREREGEDVFFVEEDDGVEGLGAGGLDEGHGPVLGWGPLLDVGAVYSDLLARGSAQLRGAVDLLGGTPVALRGRRSGARLSRICRGYDAGAARERLIAREFSEGAAKGRRLYPGTMRIGCRFLMPDLQGLRRHREAPHIIAMVGGPCPQVSVGRSELEHVHHQGQSKREC